MILVIDEIQKISNWSEAVKKEWDASLKKEGKPFRTFSPSFSFSLFTFHFSLFTSHPFGRGRGWALERAVAHAARSGDSGQCCRECCNGNAHNDLPQTLLFFHLFNLLFYNLLFTIYLQFILISHLNFSFLISHLKSKAPEGAMLKAGACRPR